MPAQRSGSGSQRAGRGPTHAQLASSLAPLEHQVAQVRPARFEAATPSPT